MPVALSEGICSKVTYTLLLMAMKVHEYIKAEYKLRKSKEAK